MDLRLYMRDVVTPSDPPLLLSSPRDVSVSLMGSKLLCEYLNMKIYGTFSVCFFVVIIRYFQRLLARLFCEEAF